MIWYGMLRYDMTWYGMPRRAVAGMSCYWEAKDPLEGLCRLLMCPTMQCDASNMPNYALHFYNMPNSWNRILASTSSISRRRAVVSAVQCGVRIVVIASGGQADFWNVMWEPRDGQSSHHYHCQSSLDVVL